jgi:hypothetical protein
MISVGVVLVEAKALAGEDVVISGSSRRFRLLAFEFKLLGYSATP